MNYEEDIAIDPHNLDEECFKQPSLCHVYTKQYLDAQEKYKHVKSKLTLDIKLNPTKYIDKKDVRITDTVLEAILYNQKEYTDAKRERDTLKFALENISRQKSTSLGRAIELFKLEYFSTVREPRQEVKSGKRMVDKATEKREKETRKRLRRSI